MSYRENDKNTRKFTPRFSVDEWISFRKRLAKLIEAKVLSERDEKILTEIIVNMKTTAQLAYLARTDENYSWLQSNRHKPLCVRRIQDILTDNFPEFHIQTTHKKDGKKSLVRKEQYEIRKTMITEESVCGKCGCKTNLEIHHLFPVCIGGDNDDRNLIILCENCYRQATDYFKTKISKAKSEIGTCEA